MAFGKKKSATMKFDQSNVSMLASDALAKKRTTLVRLPIRVVGDTPLLMHRWTQKAILQMVGKMVGQDQPRTSKDMTEEYEASWYRNEKGELAMPCRILKASIMNGAIMTQGVTSKAELKRGLRVLGYTAPIRIKRGGEMRMDQRIAKNNGSPDMRSRALIPAGYHFDVVLQFATDLTPDKVTAALEGAGSSIGLCDWRPEKGGDYGTFSVKVLDNSHIERILEECSSPEEEYVIPPEFLRAFAPTTDVGKKVQAVVGKVNGESKRGRAKREELS